ncbi:hypothetical protein Poli38472_008106 [Pythium oligandrum]|uniref:EF-hand domain-containing protein n=1 Tax=Pythium oligandrum TaxID=41045 RepID=A0A8K1CLW8_PYTOL|nr:hypothetical protein Poli38472_008106 [Pythium oligandrum]|eukprot:TMW65464.1 hypothetical protein Poli38472_008106 [Pythium oligandrum]
MDGEEEMQLDAFRDRLRDGVLSVTYHGQRGEPLRGVLELQEDKVTLVWRNTSQFQYFQQHDASIKISDVCSVREGRQTTNFIRTIKYVAQEDLPANDECCLSLCTQGESGERGALAAIDTFDVEFDDSVARNIALSFFLAETNLSGTIDLYNDAADIPLPTGWPTRCYQLVAHPSFELLVFVVVAVNMVFIALKPFILDDDQLLINTKPKMTENMSALEVALLILLTVEQVAKIIGLEGVRPLLRHKWDAFDFVVVLVSWLAVTPSSALSGFNMLSLRLFRGVRMFKHWKEFHEVVETFLVSLPMAGNAILCYCYYLFLFAILGMYLFNDSLEHRCATVVSPSSNGFLPSSGAKEYLAAFPNKFCRMQDSGSCRKPLECVPMKAPNNGFTGFHSFEASFLTVFLISLRSGFGPAMDGAMQASSYLSIIYFIGLMVFVSYMILSLFVGIVRGSYINVTVHRASRTDERRAQLENYQKKQRIAFPSGTEHFPDVLKVVLSRWQTYRVQARETVFQSPIFVTNEHEDTFLSRVRLRRDQIFFTINPEGKLMERLCAICDSPIFEHFMNIVVFMNSLLFAMEYHGMPHDYASKLYAAENALILVYAGEFFIVCASAGGLVNYLKNPWNQLDFFILMCAFVEFFCLATSLVLYTDTYTRAIFVLRLFRLVRPFRVIRKKNELLHVLDAMIASVPAFLSLASFYVLLNSLFAIVGMNLFGGKFPLSMRSHFNTFGDSILTLFKISCGGDTWRIFYASLQASSFAVAFMYYMAYFILSVYLVLNFMLVVLLRNFGMKEDDKKKMLSNLFQDRMLVMQRLHHFDEYFFLQDFSELYRSDIMYATLSGSAEKRAKIEMTTTEEMKFRLLKILPTSDFLKLKGYSRSGPSSTRVHGAKYSRLDASSPVGGASRRSAVGFDFYGAVHDTQFGTGFVGRIRRFFSGDWLTSDVSLFLFPPHSRVRLKCKRLEKETDKFIFTCIVIRTVLLTLQSPLYGALIQEFTTLTEILFVFVMVFEFTIKVIARGFLFTPNSYLSNPMNQINMVVLMACSLLLLLPHSTMVILFRLGRAFGPVRVFYRVKMFRVITEALKQSLKQIFYCVVIMLFLFYSFATLGMQFFAGKFSFCNDSSVSSRLECDGFYWNTKTGVLTPRVWGNLSGMHFDNITGAISSVVVLVSKKGWLPVLNLAMDIVDGNHQPVQNASAYFALFFVGFIFFTRFYMLKVFAGIIMNNFRCYNGTLLLSNLQLIWMRTKLSIIEMKPKYPLPQNKYLQQAQIFVQTRGFRMFTSFIVMLHTILLAWYRSPVGREFLDDLNGDSTMEEGGVWWLHYVFSMIYAIDAVMCIISLGWKDFLMKGFTWRTTNSVTAFVMLVGPLLSNSPVLLVLGMTRAFDFKHISLVFERFESIRTLFETLLASVRLTLKVTLLLGYVLFIFATFGMQLFSLTRWNYGLDSNTNYWTFPNAYAAFVKFTAGEDWYDSYQACSAVSPKCVTTRYSSDCGSPFLSAVFYHTFYVLVVLVLQNLYVATMVDTFVSSSAVGEKKDESLQLLGFRSEDLKHFSHAWSVFDANALGYLHKKHLVRFLARLDPPLGLGSRGDIVSKAITQADRDGLSAMAKEELVGALYRKRKEEYQDIEARVTELIFRLRMIHDDHMGVDFTCPPSMIRFTDLLVVLTTRIVPLDSLTVQEKVDELAVRGYVRRHRASVKIQSIYRMYRVRCRRRRKRTRSSFGADETTVDLPGKLECLGEAAFRPPNTTETPTLESVSVADDPTWLTSPEAVPMSAEGPSTEEMVSVSLD